MRDRQRLYYEFPPIGKSWLWYRWFYFMRWWCFLPCRAFDHRWVEERHGVRNCTRCGKREWLMISRKPSVSWH